MSKRLTAKFMCQGILSQHTTNPEDVQAKVILHAVYGNGEENKEWSKYTPAGNIDLTVTTESAANFFEIGAEYYLEFKPAKSET